MNPRSAAEVAFGVAGIWLVVSRIPDILLTLWFSAGEPAAIGRWVGLIHFGLVAGCGLGLVVLRRWLARWLVPVSEPALAGSIPGLQAAAFSVIGLLFVAHGLADLLGRLAMLLSDPQPVSLPRVAPPLVQLTVGLAIFGGARGLVKVWRAGRAAGLSQADSD